MNQNYWNHFNDPFRLCGKKKFGQVKESIYFFYVKIKPQSLRKWFFFQKTIYSENKNE